MSEVLHLNTHQYDVMVARGAYENLGKRVELIHGVVRQMNPAGPVHGDLIDYLTRWSIDNTRADEVRVRVQSGISLPEFDSRPEPDIVWLNPKRYMEAHPTAKDVLLLIEVSDSSLENDQNLKMKLYSASGIPEYWVVSVDDEVVHVFREPSSHGYRWLVTAKLGNEIAPTARPMARLSISDLFGHDPTQ